MRKIFILLLMCGLSAGLAAGSAPAENSGREAQAPSQKPGKPGKPGWRRGAGGSLYWRVFNRMTAEERRAMMELQAKDPTAFQQKMRKLVEELRAADAARRERINALAERCRTGTEAEKKAAREELTKIFRDGFHRRLSDSKRHLAEMRQRMERLSETLKKKEANAEAEIEAAVDMCIRGVRPEPPPREKNFPPPEHR